MKRKGFTLIELMAVIVVLGLVLALSSISITSILTQSKKDTFEKLAESILRSVTAEKLKDPNLSLGFVNAEKLKEFMTIDTTNLSTIKFINQGDDIAIYLVGANRYDGVSAFGTIEHITVETTIVQNGLVLNLDAANPYSYPGTGTKWYSMVGGSSVTLNAPTYNTNGYFSFNGTGTNDGVIPGDRVTGFNATVTDTRNGTTGVSYSLWLRVTAAQPNGQTVLFGASTQDHIELKGEGTTNPYFRTEAKLTNGYAFGTGTIPGGSLVNRWVNFVIVFSKSVSPRQVYWYHNGSLFYTATNFDSGASTTSEYFDFTEFGRSTGSTLYLYSNSFKGDLSQFHIYNKALSASEVKQNFDAQKARYGL